MYIVESDIWRDATVWPVCVLVLQSYNAWIINNPNKDANKDYFNCLINLINMQIVFLKSLLDIENND